MTVVHYMYIPKDVSGAAWGASATSGELGRLLQVG